MDTDLDLSKNPMEFVARDPIAHIDAGDLLFRPEELLDSLLLLQAHLPDRFLQLSTFDPELLRRILCRLLLPRETRPQLLLALTGGPEHLGAVCMDDFELFIDFLSL
ncbi:hypothetical protein N7513_003934 [Penicillium frequentans]|nr:hypothetical protein N7513_003934 [Penicillium glabrum]